ncbi:Rieske 2Fe-2S domain-containing protein [Aquabacterium sp.]|uniref:aromatic ring-hydroxylating dioxygenase subunit alpha n=1 Tax=Aquabacterium sp. TaxID=1872578 RepID=UPI003783686C
MGTNDADALARAEAERILNTGLRNLWYPVAPGWQVGSAPVGITRLGEKIVLWRDGQGQVHALEDRCPHRGARLSLGWNLGDRVACWYHGIEVAGSGTVARVPASANCPLEGRSCVKSYPVQERAGAIFLWFANQPGTPPAELALPEELCSDEHSHFLCMSNWKTNYRYAIDNVMDPMHGAYLHASSHSMAEGDKSAEMRVRKTPTGLIFEKTGQQGVNFDWVELGDTGCLWLRLSIPYQKRYGPGGSFGIVGFATPVDEHHTQVYFWRTRKVQGWQRNVWRFLYRNRLEGLHWAVLEQDQFVLESLPEDARNREFLYEHDVGLARVRRMLEKRAAEQAQARIAAAAATAG